MTEEIKPLKPGDICWDGLDFENPGDLVLILYDKETEELKNMYLKDFTIYEGNLKGETLQNSYLVKNKIDNINNLNKELLNIFKQKGVLKNA